MTQCCGALGPRWGEGNEEIVQDVHDSSDVEFVVDYPFQGDRSKK